MTNVKHQAKALQKDKAEGSSTPFCFDILAQLANIPTRVTLCELLRLSKSTREALREALPDSEAFIAQTPARREKEDEEHCLQTYKYFPLITLIYKSWRNMIDLCTTHGILDK